MDSSQVTFREAAIQDLERIVYMLSDDDIGNTRELYKHPLPESYIKAFQSINSDPNNELIVACYGVEIVGVQQITFSPYITHQGGWRAAGSTAFLATIFNNTRLVVSWFSLYSLYYYETTNTRIQLNYA